MMTLTTTPRTALATSSSPRLVGVVVDRLQGTALFFLDDGGGGDHEGAQQQRDQDDEGEEPFFPGDVDVVAQGGGDEVDGSFSAGELDGGVAEGGGDGSPVADEAFAPDVDVDGGRALLDGGVETGRYHQPHIDRPALRGRAQRGPIFIGRDQQIIRL